MTIWEGELYEMVEKDKMEYCVGDCICGFDGDIRIYHVQL